jgi:two-component system chemotaxis sensor kinase CheA
MHEHDTTFAEEYLAALDEIEPQLMELDDGAGAFDVRKTTEVLRAVRAVAGGACLHGLRGVVGLSRRLANLLHLARGGAIAPEGQLVAGLMRGFGALRAGLEGELEPERAAGIVAEIEALMPESARSLAATEAPISGPDGAPLFSLDQLVLDQAAQSGKRLYLLRFQLERDIVAKNRTPIDVVSNMQKSGVVIDCTQNEAGGEAVFYVLYATIIDPDIAGRLFWLPEENIHPLDEAYQPTEPIVVQPIICIDMDSLDDLEPASTPGEPPAAPENPSQAAGNPGHDNPGHGNPGHGNPGHDAHGPFRIEERTGGMLLSLGESATIEQAQDLHRALLDVVSRGANVRVDGTMLVRVDVSALQLLAAARNELLGRGLFLTTIAPMDGPLGSLVGRLGFEPLLELTG